MKPNELFVHVDVDDTLVRQTGSKRIPMVAVVDHVRRLHAVGATLYCWIAGGAASATVDGHLAALTRQPIHDPSLSDGGAS